MSDLLVEMKNIVKTFPGVKALDNAQLELRKGEVLGLLGENGAGKSTLMNVLGGIYPMDSGTIKIDGVETKITSVADARSKGIAFIHQEIALVPFLSIAENIYLGRELKTHNMVDRKKMSTEAKKYVDMVGLQVNPNTMVHDLSIAQQQMVEIAKACSFNMKILIMDEPTSSLSEQEVKQLFKVIRDLSRQGIGIIYISHKLSELYEITDKICVMRDGGYIDTVVTKDTPEKDLVSMMVGRTLTSYYKREYNKRGEMIFKAEHISSGKRVKDCSFEVHRGEIFGFYGLVGAGRSELIKACMGLYPRDSGKVYLKGEDVSNLSTMKIQQRGIALVPEDRKTEGLILKDSIADNISLSVLPKFIRHLHVNHKLETEIVDKEIKDLNVKTPSREQRVGNLSGGNQQKVVLAKWLASEPDVLILDEPTRGIDVGAKAEIYSIMNELAKQGMAIIMISSEMPEIVNMCDEIAVMSDGKITGLLQHEEFSQEAILSFAVRED